MLLASRLRVPLLSSASASASPLRLLSSRAPPSPMSAAAAAEAGPVQRAVTEKLRATFAPVHLQVLNESHMHSVPRGSETHFKVTVVSAAFDPLPSLLARHRAVNACLAHELANGVHALSITARTPKQWEADQTVAKSPACLGGSKHDQQRNE